VLVREAFVFQRKNVPLVISAPKGDFALYNKRQELSVVTAVRLRHDFKVLLIKTSWIVKCYRPGLITKIHV